MRWGPQIEFLERMERDMGIKPKALLNRPTPLPTHEELLRAFNVLSSSRHYSAHGHPLPIPVSEMFAFCQMFFVSTYEEREQFVHFIQGLDSAYMTQVAENSATRTESDVAPN